MMKFLVILGLALVAWRMWTGRWPWEPKLQGTTRQQSLAQARRLIGVGEGASHGDIVEGHRRLIARVHPDKGGSAEQVHEANAARDLLLAELTGK